MAPHSSTTPTLRKSRSETLGARIAFGFAATAVALFLMVFYVRLLNESVSRGSQWRYSQKTTEPADGLQRSAVNTVTVLPVKLTPP